MIVEFRGVFCGVGFVYGVLGGYVGGFCVLCGFGCGSVS